MKEIVISLVISVHCLIVAYAVLKRRSGEFADGYTYRFDIVYFIIALAGLGFFNWAFLGYLFSNLAENSPFWKYVAGAAWYTVFELLSLYLCLQWGCLKLVLTDEYIAFRNLWGYTKRYRYSDITNLQLCYRKKERKGFRGYILRFRGGGRIHIDYHMQFLYNDPMEAIKKRAIAQKNWLNEEICYSHFLWL